MVVYRALLATQIQIEPPHLPIIAKPLEPIEIFRWCAFVDGALFQGNLFLVITRISGDSPFRGRTWILLTDSARCFSLCKGGESP